MTLPIASLLLPLLVSSWAADGPHPAGELKYEIRPGCHVESILGAEDGKPLSRLMVTLNDKTAPEYQGRTDFRSFVQNEAGLLIPMQGFFVCDGFDVRPVKAELYFAGDYQRIVMKCGGRWSIADGQAELIFKRSTKRLVHAKVLLDGARGVPKVHSGPVKYRVKDFDCRGAEYEAATAALAAVKPSAIGTIDGGRFTLDGKK